MNRTFLPAPALPPGRPRLVITGFMGTGKTSVGREAAGRLGLPFVDTDEVVERMAGRSIPDIFSTGGEAEFRRLERRAVLETARLSGAVVATGGGALLDPSFGEVADGAVVAVLTCDVDELIRRLRGASGRPLLQGDPGTSSLTGLLQEREAAYAGAGEGLDTTNRTPGEVGAELAERYRLPLLQPPQGARIEVSAPGGGYAVTIGPGALNGLGREIRAALPGAVAAFVVADAGAEDPHGRRAAEALADTGVRIERATIPAGEAAKSLQTVAGLWSRFRQAGLSRTDVVVAVGGGATLDTVGFAAATFARGIPVVNVPTTLLAMVDAGMGGKTGIDHEGMKNLLGVFHHPSLVVADTTMLATLAPGVVRAGLAEVVKAFVIASPMALSILEALPVDGLGLPEGLDWLVEQAVRVKAAYVAQDPEDRGLRHSLNVGHTFAHGIESASGYAIPHGEAVAIGLPAAARLGSAYGVTDPALAPRLEALLGRLGLPVRVPGALSRGRMLAAMGSDKKRREGQAVFVVPAPGGAELLAGLDPDEALEHLAMEGSA